MRRMKLQHTGDSGAVVVTDDEEDTEQLQDAGKPKRRRASKEAESPEYGKEHGIPGKEKRLRSPPPEVPIEVLEKEKEEDEEMGNSDVDGYGIAYIPTPAQRDLRRQKRLAAVSSLCGLVEASADASRSRSTRAARRRRRGRSGQRRGGGGGGVVRWLLEGVVQGRSRRWLGRCPRRSRGRRYILRSDLGMALRGLEFAVFWVPLCD